MVVYPFQKHDSEFAAILAFHQHDSSMADLFIFFCCSSFNKLILKAINKDVILDGHMLLDMVTVVI